MKKLLYLLFLIPATCWMEPRFQLPKTPDEIWQNDLDLRDGIKGKANRTLDNIYNVDITTSVLIDSSIFIDSVSSFPTDKDTYVFFLRTNATGSSPFDQAGSIILRPRVSSTAGRSSIYLYSGSPTALGLELDEIGSITQPLQPSFLVQNSTGPSNMTGDGSTYTMFWPTVIYDQGSDFTNDDKFTAPVTGRYLLSATIQFQNVTADVTYLYIDLNTSNRTYAFTEVDPGVGSPSVTVTAIADMDAGDIVKVRIQAGGTTKTIDVINSAVGNYFSGSLIN